MTLGRYTILLVEDEPADAHLVRMAFAESGAKVDLHHTVDGIQAMEFLDRKGDGYAEAPRPDLILLDLNMPRMGGREFLAEIKNKPEFRSIPVVVLTTSDVERDTLSSYQLGAAGYVVKPVDMDQFMVEIRRLNDYWFSLVRLPEQRG